ncbi:hypothetical protein pdam_00019701 [Pocillopora damicornis]|uniref:C-type lectin domain-containing protein n=1 Tax=Pocillopora damicornis TaxID=46731 RepID=A0A3M6UXN6_POCDA|nr:hypothetical protein pdam_00019701 [Pocillopora damicornis]
MTLFPLCLKELLFRLVQVHVSLSYGEEFSRVHSPSTMWVRSITTRGFDVCVRETGSARNESGVINWVAFQDHMGMIHGSLEFSGIWTTETKCNKVDFSKDWFAFTGSGTDLNFTLTGEARFENRNTPKVEDNYGFCQEVSFNTTFYTSPVVLVSVHHFYDRQQKSLILPENNIITAWVEEIRLTSMTICVKDLSGTGSKHDPLSVYYVVIGDLNPCLGVHCPSFGICKTFSAYESRCVCYEDCPSYQDPVCTTNGTTYDNQCWYELNYCRGLEKNSVYHPGSCEGFPLLRDKIELRVPKWSDSSCETVIFPPYRFYPEKQVHVQITVTHMNLNDSETVHDAVTSWIEDSNTENFTVCAMQSGRKSRNFNPFATVIWVAYQGAPPNGMTGIIKMQEWWSGTKCAKDKFKSAPVVLVTAEHLRTGVEYDAALIWTEDATNDSFKVCLREMQNFDGKHEDITVNWMAFTDLHKPFFTEHGFIKFPNTNPPLDENNNAYCQNMNSTGFRACLKELYETRYEPVSLSYAVLTDICDPGWNYFDGHCYFTSKTCANWTTALRNCRNENSAIADIKSSEENVFIQHRHNGEKSWLGLNDRTSEGNFTWADRGRGNFTAWAKNQPNNFKEEDCVHALGIKYRYEWNDVKCSDCHQYTCKKDLDECNTNQDACDSKASCINTVGSYTCLCDSSYQGDGFECSPTLGLYSSDPAHSCKEMRDLGLSRKDGKYWIDPEKNGTPLKVFCDMTTDGVEVLLQKAENVPRHDGKEQRW